MRLVVLGAAILAAACGRISFVPIGDAAETDAVERDAVSVDALALVPCVSDDFNTGADGWVALQAGWTLPASGAADGTAFYQAVGGGYHSVTHPALADVTAVDVEFDVLIGNASTGDFYVYLLPEGALPAGALTIGYRYGLFPTGSDAQYDNIEARDGSNIVLLAMRALTVTASTWYRIGIVRATDGTMRMSVNGATHLQTASDTTMAGPFDVAFAFFDTGGIDNVTADCAH